MKADKISWERTYIDGKECCILHFTDLLTLSEYQNTLITGEFDEAYNTALNRAHAFGGKRDIYYTTQGGIVFEASITDIPGIEQRLKTLFDGID